MAETYFPPVDPARQVTDAPVRAVVVLEDRARVERRGLTRVSPGTTRLVVHGVAPVAQDVSVRAEVISGTARVADARVRRALRILQQDKGPEVAALDAELRRLREALQAESDDRSAVTARRERVLSLLRRAIEEIPEDVAWGRVDAQAWRDTLDGLTTRARALAEAELDHWLRESDLAEDLRATAYRRWAFDRVDQHFTAWIEVDLVCEADDPGGEVELALFYTVPCALWRPTHQARLDGDRLEIRSRAAVWQRTGEDWTDVELRVSTARSSLGVSPPLLSDDLLQVERRPEEVVIAARQVAVRTTGPAGAPPSSVELPGVDDGGEVRTLLAPRPARVPSDGRPVFIELSRTSSPARVENVAFPELAEAVLRRVTATHVGAAPLLAGPVELLADGGPIGQTELLFVAPGQTFELGFGPEPELRLVRATRNLGDDKPDRVDKWRRKGTLVELFLSNLGDREQRVLVTERIPVSETEYVRIERLEARTTGAPTIDANGFVRWELTLPPYAQHTLKLGWELAIAPDVKGNPLG